MRIERHQAAAVGVAMAAVAISLVLLGPAGAAAADGAGNVSVYHGPAAGFEDAEAVRRAIDAGGLEPAERVVTGEALVVAIHSERLASDLETRSGPPDERFFAVLEATDATFRLLQTDAATHSPPKLLQLGPSNVTVHRAGATTFVVVETGGVGVRYAYPDRHEFPPAELHGGERFAAEFGYGLPPVPDSGSAVYEPAGPQFTLYHAAAEFSGFAYRYEPLAPETFVRTVRVNVPPDDALVVRLALDDDRRLTAPVRAEDFPAAERVWFDLRAVEPGTEYTLELVHDGTVVDGFSGTVREPRATVGDVSVVQLGEQSAVRVTAELSHGGTVRIRNAACERIGWARLEPGNRSRRTVELWRPSGEPLRIADPANYSLLVRAARERGATTALYPGQDATARRNADGLRCEPPEAAAPPDAAVLYAPAAPTPASPVVTTEPTVRTTAGSPTGSASTGTPGQPGFTLLAALASLALAALGTRRDTP